MIQAMTVHLEKLGYMFTAASLLIGGKAMEYYGLRKAGDVWRGGHER